MSSTIAWFNAVALLCIELYETKIFADRVTTEDGMIASVRKTFIHMFPRQLAKATNDSILKRINQTEILAEQYFVNFPCY